MPTSADTQPGADATYRKAAWHLIPLLFACYVAAYLDRVNAGFAKLTMKDALHLDDDAFGFGLGVFFIGYLLFEIPSNLLLHRVGARRWIARIMVSWGVISAAMMFARSATSFYVLRFLLGFAEAGFFPGIILYLTYWFPAERRGRATSLFLTAVAVAGVVGNPLSGWILHALEGAGGLQGWQWLFALEAIPSVVLGVAVWFLLDDRVEDATWLTPAERALIARDIAAEASRKADTPLAQVLAKPSMWGCALVYFGIVSGLYGVSFGMPSLIKEMGVVDPLRVGLVGAVPWLFGSVAMALVARSADRRGESRWHTALSCLAGAAGLLLCAFAGGDVVLGMAGLTVCAMGIMSALPVSWSLPTALLGGTAAAAGIAMINSLGNLAGFATPWIVGILKTQTKSTTPGLVLIAALMAAGGLAELALRKPAAQAWPGRVV